MKVYHDRYLGEEEESVGKLLSKTEGDKKVRQISECPEPWDKKCRCPEPWAYFGDCLG
jgi:hypothetical protein